MKNKDAVIQVKDLTVCYGQEEIIRSVSLEVKQGEVLGIAGESGSGKTTLLRSLMGIMNNETEVRGTIRFLDKDIQALTRKELNELHGKLISMIPQNAMLSMDPLFRISSLVHETLCAHGKKIRRKESDTIAASIMESLLFDDPQRILQSYPFELSGGMAQRAAILLSILNRPSLLLGDEPTSALDGTSQYHVVRQLKQMKEQMNLSMIIVSHNLGVLDALSDQIAIMYAGRIIEFGTREEILFNPIHPYTRALLDAIPKKDKPMAKGLPGVPPAFGEKITGCAFAKRCPHVGEECLKAEVPDTYVSTSHRVQCMKIKE